VPMGFHEDQNYWTEQMSQGGEEMTTDPLRIQINKDYIVKIEDLEVIEVGLLEEFAVADV
jgi:hypothetical protein